MKTLLKLGALTLAAALSVAAHAADVATEAMQAAYAPYRSALFRTNGKSQPEARQAISQAQIAWTVQTLKGAAVSQDVAALKAAIAKLKAPYSKLFIKFG